MPLPLTRWGPGRPDGVASRGIPSRWAPELAWPVSGYGLTTHPPSPRPPAPRPPASMPWLRSLWRTSSNRGCPAWHPAGSSSSPRRSVSWGDLGGGPGQPLPTDGASPPPLAAALIYGSACISVAALSSLLGGGVLQVSPRPRERSGTSCLARRLEGVTPSLGPLCSQRRDTACSRWAGGGGQGGGGLGAGRDWTWGGIDRTRMHPLGERVGLFASNPGEAETGLPLPEGN